MSSAFHIGVVGLGTVGASVVRILQDNADDIALKAGREIVVKSVSAKSKDKQRDCDTSQCEWSDNPVEDMAGDSGLDAVVELVGGSDGLAYDLVKSALKRGVNVVTANKALLAHHGPELASLSENANAELRYEAAVAGAIPSIKALREGLSANPVHSIYGILNGTCNYILTEMDSKGADFDAVLKDAQDKGYAEADPSFDVDGDDTGHKISLLSALAFGTYPRFSDMVMRGIRAVTQTDIAYARELGYRIKLLGLAERAKDGVLQTVEPCLVPIDRPIAAVSGSQNAVFFNAAYAKDLLLVGRGAGGEETASAVIADIIDLARGQKAPVFGRKMSAMVDAPLADVGARVKPVYMRLMVEDQPGVFADIARVVADHNLSIKSAFQKDAISKGIVPVVMVLHDGTQSDVDAAIDALSKLKAVKDAPFTMQILD